MERDYEGLVGGQRAFFESGGTRDLGFRIRQLKQFMRMIEEGREAILKAIASDLGRPAVESVVAEVKPMLQEVDLAIARIRYWSRPRRVATPSFLFPASSHVLPEPLGVALIISPWNYPVALAFTPLISAVAAGNCAVLKPSELAPESSRLIAELVSKYFDPSFVAAVEGGAAGAEELLSLRFDHIFYTGGAAVGRKVMEAAARNLTPLTLELGGKSPCIVDADCDVGYAARRIVIGKFSNAGQTCIAPDYLLVHGKVKRALMDEIAGNITGLYGENPLRGGNYSRIVNSRHFDRLAGMLEGLKAAVGGETDRDSLYISPTVIDGAPQDSPLMAEEIFGPILPVIEYGDLDEAIDFVNAKPKPLALYFFCGDEARQRRVLEETTSGAVCINDTMIHYSNPKLPFGGVGSSGFGRYHGRAGFAAFSNMKSVIERPVPGRDLLGRPPLKRALRWMRRYVKYTP